MQARDGGMDELVRREVEHRARIAVRANGNCENVLAEVSADRPGVSPAHGLRHTTSVARPYPLRRRSFACRLRFDKTQLAGRREDPSDVKPGACEQGAILGLGSLLPAGQEPEVQVERLR